MQITNPDVIADFEREAKASDEDLMQAYANGQPEAFDALFTKYGQKVYNLFLRALGNADTAGDLVQETFMRVIQARGRYQPTRTFSSWLYTIAMNLLRDQLRRRKRRGTTEELSETNLDMHVSEPEVELSERRAAVQKAVQALPAEQREVILLAKYQGRSYAEIAAILGISAVAAKQRPFRALKTLQEKLIHLKGDI